MTAIESASTAQLADVLAAISSQPDEASAAREAVARAMRMLRADAAALVRDGVVVASAGLSRRRGLRAALCVVADGVHTIQVARVGWAVLSVPFGDDPDRLVLARPRESFTREEEAGAAAIARALGIVVGSRRVLERERCLREQNESEAQARLHQALHDPLTELANRALFLDRLEHAFVRTRREQTEIGLLIVDLDRFRAVNDSLGHAAGDLVLREVASRVRATLRGGDTAARLAADQFGLLIANVKSAADVLAVAERVSQAVRAPIFCEDRQVLVTVGIGVTVGADANGDAGEALRNADVAMRAAKVRGKGNIAMFDPSMHADQLERIELEADLQRALDEEQFVVHYQPIVSVEDGALTGLEALVRWNHPTRGLIPPAAFIPVAEEWGLIIPIGRWVLRRACRDLRSWLDAHPDLPLTVAVNLSATEFSEPSLVSAVGRALDDAGLAAESLVLEITESVFMHDSEAAIARMWELKHSGARLAIDDFGMGFSSLSYLQRFPVDILKIDKSFIDGIAQGAETSALGRAIIRLGHALELETIAEGVEELKQLERLRALRCHRAQGFLFSEPVDAVGISELLAGTGDAPRRRLRSVG